ncbi:MAG: hypothetical protein QNJ78_00395 [Gammaproteobacteria bacterium]|nr:hypothetical protein [Gammaproteobacteria bacterium]
MRVFNKLNLARLLKVASILLLPVAAVADVVLYPGYIQGTVTVGDFNVYSTHVSASGGGYSSSKSTSGNTYTLTVQGGPWEYNVNARAYIRPTTSYYPYTQMYFSNRTMAVSEGETVQNDYNVANPGVIEFQINITGDAYNSWSTNGYAYNNYVAGEERTNSYGYTRSSDTPDGIWEMPVVPNTGVRIYAYVYIDGKRYDFGIASPYYYKDIAAGETVVVPIDIVHDATPNDYGVVQGDIELIGVDSFNYHYVYASGDRDYQYTNPAHYYMDQVQTGSQYIRAYSYFDNYSTYFRWPFIDGIRQNNILNVVAGGNYTLDFISDTGILTGDVTLTGTLANEDLNSFQLRAQGISSIYEPGTGWVTQPTYYGYTHQTKYGTDPNPTTYRLFLTPGPWRSDYLYAYERNYDLGYQNRSIFTIQDYNYYYDGNYYNFGQNVDVEPGATTVQDREYCTGSLLVRFRDASGGLLRNPRLDGSTPIYEDGKQKFYVYVNGYSYPPEMEAPEVEVHGYPATYPFYARAYTEDGSYVTFARFDESLECGVRKGRDFDGPTLTVETPPAGDITNAQSVNVSGTATDDSGVASITVNGVSVTITPTGNPEDPNEVSYTYDLAVVTGANTITVVALDTNDNASSNARDIYVDHWLPEVTINSPADGSYFKSFDNAIELDVIASDQGYGFSLTVSLDGELIHEVSGPANDTTASSLSFGETRSLDIGPHTITATVSDLAGNSTTESVNIQVNAPPVALCQDITVTTDTGACSVQSASVDDGSHDPDGVQITQEQVPYGPYTLGDTKVVLTVTDQFGESNSCTATVTVVTATPPDIISGPFSGNVTIAPDQAVQILPGGTVFGNVILSGGTLWVSGSIEGNIEAKGVGGDVCLDEGANVTGNVIQEGSRIVDFIGGGAGSSVNGNVEMFNGTLYASGLSSNNYVDGSVKCDGGLPANPGATSNWNWDGLHEGTGEHDGRLGGNYECP